MISLLLSMIVLINPFALFVYLVPVIKDLPFGAFLKVLFKASLISYVIYAVFSQFGEFIFNNILSIHFESFRIFGGLIIIAIALDFIIQGKKAFLTMKGSLQELASEIALPFMVGASSIAISIIIGNKFATLQALLIIALALSINYGTIVLLVLLKNHLPSKKLKLAFDNFMGYFLRINGFLVGAIGIDMTSEGIKNMFLN